MSDDEREKIDTEEMTLDSMHGVLTHAFISELQAAENVWPKLSQAKQDAVIERCRSKSEWLIREMAILIANKGFDSTPAIVDGVTFKSGVKSSIKIPDKEGAHKLADHDGQGVLIVFADIADFLGGYMPASDPDQTDLVSDDFDGLYKEAIEFVIENEKTSISALQRALRIGYNRSARIIEAMERAEIISSMDSVGKREILIDDAEQAINKAFTFDIGSISSDDGEPEPETEE